jgi:Domain of unknown function (DUF5615)
VRILLDEDVPYDVASALTARGLDAVHVNDLQDDLGRSMRTDAQVCAESARLPTVLVTCNVRDFADRAFQEANVVRHGIAVALVRLPKDDGDAGRPAVVRDIVHRWAHRFAGLHAQAPVVVSLSSAGFRAHQLPGAAQRRQRQPEPNGE